MDFDLSSEQRMLKDSAERFVSTEYEFTKRRAIVSSEDGFSREHWRTFAELGWLGLPIPEAYGGLGGTPVDVMVLMEAFGRGLVAEPYLTTVLLTAGLIREAGSEEQKQAYLPKIAAGECLGAFAFAEPSARFELASVSCTATPVAEGYRLDGHKSVVLHGPSADLLVVTARTSGGPRDRDGISLFLVDAAHPGIERVEARAFSGVPVAEVVLQGAEVPAESRLGPAGAGLAAVEKVVDEAVAALCAEAVGAMSAVHEATNEYLKTRQQFGQPIGRFQVIQHRMVDMFMELEQSRSLAVLANLKLEADPGERARACACAKAQIGRAGKFVGGQAVQLHGGMGMTDELNVSHYYKYLMMVDILFGNADYQTRRFARLTQ